MAMASQNDPPAGTVLRWAAARQPDFYLQNVFVTVLPPHQPRITPSKVKLLDLGIFVARLNWRKCA
jgi:hypothetical protein